MERGLDRRVKPAVSYAESEGANPSPSNTPPSQRKIFNVDDDADDAEEDDEDEILFTTSRSRRGLRERKPNQSLKFLENGDKSAKSYRPKKRGAIEEVCT